MGRASRMRKSNHGNLNTSFYFGWQERHLSNTRGMQRERERICIRKDLLPHLRLWPFTSTLQLGAPNTDSSYRSEKLLCGKKQKMKNARPGNLWIMNFGWLLRFNADRRKCPLHVRVALYRLRFESEASGWAPLNTLNISCSHHTAILSWEIQANGERHWALHDSTTLFRSFPFPQHTSLIWPSLREDNWKVVGSKPSSEPS